VAKTAIQVPASRGAEPCVARTLTNTAGSAASQTARVSSEGSANELIGSILARTFHQSVDLVVFEADR
jgi:ABC-type uncharacterized transport system permease subunit